MEQNTVETIILRFRNMFVTNFDTIQQHVDIIENKGYVWWACWKKGHEITPVGVFGELNVRAKISDDGGHYFIW